MTDAFSDPPQDEAADICQVTCLHPESVQNARKILPSLDTAQAMAELFRVAADPGRLRLLCALESGELCVCDLAALLDVSVSALSHQLRLLKAQRVVKARRQGKMVFYSLDDDHVRQLIAMARAHVKHD